MDMQTPYNFYISNTQHDLFPLFRKGSNDDVLLRLKTRGVGVTKAMMERETVLRLSFNSNELNKDI